MINLFPAQIQTIVPHQALWTKLTPLQPKPAQGGALEWVSQEAVESDTLNISKRQLDTILDAWLPD